LEKAPLGVVVLSTILKAGVQSVKQYFLLFSAVSIVYCAVGNRHARALALAVGEGRTFPTRRKGEQGNSGGGGGRSGGGGEDASFKQQ